MSARPVNSDHGKALALQPLDLRTLAARASTLWERLDEDRFVPDPEHTDVTQVAERRARWMHLVGRGSAETWEKRIAWGGYTGAQIDAALGAVRLRDDLPLPDWAVLLGEIMVAASSSLDPETARRYLNPEKPLAFEELLLPIVHVACGRVAARSGSAFDRLTEEAVGHLGRGLLERLSELTLPTLLHLFEATRSAGENILLRVGSAATDEPARNRYEAFVAKLRSRELRDAIEPYPVLGRALATVVQQWIVNSTRFLLRLQADDEVLTEAYGSQEEDLGRVAALQTNLSDPHRGAQTVSIATFDSGVRVVYKPKDLRAAAAYDQLLAWCQERGLSLRHAPLHVIERNGYGWMRLIEHRSCATLDDVPRYYRNAGIQLALLHLLGASDMHYENLIASGSHPTLIDLETLLKAFLKTEGKTLSLTDLQARNSRSVARIGLLPVWIVDPRRQIAYDIGGLSFVEHTAAELPFPKLKEVNTDQMHRGVEAQSLFEEAQHTPSVAGRDDVIRPEPYVESLLAGFDEGYRFIEHHRDALAAPGGPLSGLESVMIRHVVRATRTYDRLLRKAHSPKYLQDGANRSIELDVLTWTALAESDSTRLWHVARAEVEALEQHDIPYFAAPAHQTHLPIPGREPVQAFFQEAPMKAVYRTLDQWGEFDWSFQRALIQGAYRAKQAHPTRPDRHEASDPSGITHLVASGRSESPTDLGIFEREAVRLGNELVERFIVGADGYGSWMGMNYIDEVERFMYGDVGFGLYGGSTGIALFLAALYRRTGRDQYRDTVGQAVQRMLDLLQDTDRSMVHRWADMVGIGPGRGLSGYALGLSAIGDLLGESAYTNAGLQAARLITPRRIGRDKGLDLLGGAAGAIPMLLRLHDRTRATGLLEAAVACGESLLDQQIQDGRDRGAWKRVNMPALTGFSHGVAGFAYALMRLHAVTRRAAFREAAEAALAYEDRLFIADVQNWPDLRRHLPQGTCGNQWCHGAAGIALGRLLMLAELDTEAIRRDLAAGLTTTRTAAHGRLDDLCCGNAGRLDILFTAGQVLNREHFRQDAWQYARAMVHRAEREGHYRVVSSDMKGIFAPGLFKGTSGIGYTLLRLTRPEELPSILSLDWTPSKTAS